MASAAWFSHYEPNVPHTLTYPGVPLPQLLEDAARRYPDRVATKLVLTHGLRSHFGLGSSLRYQQLNEHTNRFAAALVGLNVRPGDRVALLLPNSPQFVIALYGALKAGAIVVNLNPACTADELRHQLIDSGAETIVLLNRLQSRFRAIKAATGVRNVVVTQPWDLLPTPVKQLVRRAQQPELAWIDAPAGNTVFPFEALLGVARASLPEVQPDDAALLQYTSGTRRTPKAATLTHKNLVANTLQVIAFLPVLEPGKEKILAATPFAYMYGMTLAINVAIYLGGQMVLVLNPQSIHPVLRTIASERVTIVAGEPELYNGMINHPAVEKFDLRSIKLCISSSAALPLEAQERVGELTQGQLVESYGLTEAAAITHCNPPRGEAHTGSIGVPLPDVEAKLVDRNTGMRVRWGSDEAGELCVRGPNIMQGYWKRPAETAGTLDEDGWLHTGASARMDEAGYFYIVAGI